MDKAIKTPNRTGILVRALIVLAMCGIVNSAAVFVSPMAKHFGWTTEAIAGVATYMAFMQTPGHILSGWLLGKIGAKKTLILGCILLGLAFLLSGMVPSGSPWMLYITFSVLQGLGVGFTYTGSTYCATGWYPDKRGFASGLCMAFNGGSATFLAPLIVKLIGSIGIIVTLYIVGGAIIVIGICAAIGLCIPAVVTLTIVTAIYDAIKDNYWVWSALKGVQCAVAPIIGGAAISLGKDALTSAMPIIICAVAFVLCCFTSISNLTLVAAGVVIALVWMGVSEHGHV